MLEDLKLRRGYDGFLYLVESARNPPAMKSHRHVELELNLVVRGSISYVLRRRRFTFGQGALLWLFPSQEHQLVDRSSDAQVYVAVFRQSLIARSCRGGRYQALKRDPAQADRILHSLLGLEAFDLARRIMDDLMVGSLDPDLLNRELGFGLSSDFRFEHSDPDALNAGLRHLLLFCWRCQQAGRAVDRTAVLHPSVCKALELLGEEDLDLAQLARRSGASATHLSRMFSRQLGISMARYRNSVRLRRFHDYVRSPSQKTLSEAAYAAGFGSYAQFHRVFTQAYGCAPRKGLGRGAAPDGSIPAKGARPKA